jgi:peptide/nickel transport system permease protein
MSWRRFKRNRLAYYALWFIILMIAMSISGYLITPDNTPFANDQHLELSAKKPCFRVNMLYVRKNEIIQAQNFLHVMLFGQKCPYISVPYNNYSFKDDLISIEEYADTGTTSKRYLTYNVADVLYPVDIQKEIILQQDTMHFTDLYGRKHMEAIQELRALIEKNNIKSRRYLLGTDKFGRDVLSQLMIGARVSLSVGFISVFISLIIGITLGALAGFFRGWLDNLIIWFINVVWSIPTLLLVIAITFALGKGFWQVFVAVGLTMWVEVARVVRGQILSVREKEFVEAGKALGFSNFRIISKHILPNIMGPVIVISAANFAAAILIEAGLSFLGIGVQPPMPSWGTIIKENYPYIILDSAHLAILPGVAIMLLVLAFMIIGNGLRDALDVKIVR